jgi:hypothetical protein
MSQKGRERSQLSDSSPMTAIGAELPKILLATFG